MLHLLNLLASLHLSLALPSDTPKSSGSLLILDTGVGHRSTPVTRWRTSLRGLTTRGTNATIIQQFGPETAPGSPAEPIGAYSLAYSSSASSLYSATSQGIIHTDVDGSNPKVIITEEPINQIMSVTVAEKEGKLYYGTLYDGLIRRADLDGSNVEVVRNVSQGINWNLLLSYTPAYTYADGLLVDDEKGWLYWSASQGPDDGSVRRAPLDYKGHEQVLASGINMPGQLRLVGETLYWTEKGRWNTSPTAIKRFDLSQLRKSPPQPQPPSPTAAPVPFATQTVVHSNQSASIFFEKDYTGDKQTLSIQSFVVYRNEVEQKIWFVVQSSGRTMFGKLVEVTWKGSGDGRKAEVEVLTADTNDLGVPVGLEHVEQGE
ncbi:Nn.00g049900.m01.CDS01 [Neocucurbitaria sp. VM-36]